MKKLLLLTILFAFGTSFAQSNKKLEEQGDVAMENGLYSYAVHYYSFVLFKIDEDREEIYYAYGVTTNYQKPEKTKTGAVKPPKNPTFKEITIIHKLAKAYLKTNDYVNAEVWYASAIKHSQSGFPYSKYYYGLTLMKNYKYDEAIAVFEEFIKENGNADNRFYQLANDKIVNCHFAKNPQNSSKILNITNLDSVVNLGTVSFGLQFFSENQMIFSSAKEDLENELENPNLNGYLLDIYLVNTDDKGNFLSSEKFPADINTLDIHEGSASISPDGNILYYTSSDPLNHNNTHVYRVKKINGRWVSPQALGESVNQKGFKSMNPYISGDGKTLYFSSNRPGGKGGMDIWKADINDQGFTSNIQNLGNMINSIDDEISPFYHNVTNTLFFASKGHIGFGGMDIFKSNWNEDNESFEQVLNVGAPINSSRDDTYYILDDESDVGYITSDREFCNECDTVYNLKQFCNQVYQIKVAEINFLLKGFVYNEDTGEPIPNATIEVKDISFKWEHFSLVTDENGYYEQVLIPEVELFLKATKDEYFAGQALVTNIGETDSKVYEQDFYLSFIPDGEMVIEGIEYDFNKSTLRPSSKVILDNVVKFLELNNGISIEIRSHTDHVGPDSYNLDLSSRRAKSVYDYLIENGIDSKRLESKGYGESEPVEIVNKDGELIILNQKYIATLTSIDEKDTAHQKNRRTGFKVINR